MKTKIMIMALSCLSINAALAGQGSASVGYASDYFLRGSIVSQESIQSSVSYGADLGGINAMASAFTNQSVSSGADTYVFNGTLSKNITDLGSVSLGLEHTELVAGDAVLDVRLGGSLDVLLSPSVVVEKNIEEDLYTFEVSVAHDIDLDIVNLGLSALYGNTDSSATTDIDYYVVGASLSRSINDNALVSAGVDLVDSDSINSESIFSLALSLNF
jgi:hypothetical protein